jgi:glycosyltransferase involved in cell wall biosynthesis
VRPQTIAMFNLNTTGRDPRVRRTAGSLVAAGHRVVVFEMLAAGGAEQDTIDGIEIRRVPVPTRYEAEDMAEFRAVCRPAFDLIAHCDARVAADADGLAVRRFSPPRRLWRAVERHWRHRPPKLPLSDKDRHEILVIRSIMLVDLSLYKAAESLRPTLVHCNDLDTLLIGYMFKRNYNLPLVFDAHEIYPEQFHEDMRSDIWHHFYTELEQNLIRFTNGRMTVCDSLGKYFCERYGADGFATVLNVPTRAYQPAPDVLLRKRQRRKFLYHGAYFPYRGLEEIIRAARWVENADFVFRGIGAHGCKLKELCHTEGLEQRITFAPPVPVAEMIPAATDCDIGLNPFIPISIHFEYALPNKFFEYMMAGLGCASSDLVELGRLSRELRVGIIFPSLEPADIASCLNELLAQPDRIDEYRHNAYEAARTQFNWEVEEKKFMAFYSQFAV